MIPFVGTLFTNCYLISIMIKISKSNDIRIVHYHFVSLTLFRERNTKYMCFFSHMEFRNVIVGESAIAGRGLFATRDLKKGEVIFEFHGPVIKYSFTPNYRKGPHWLNLGKNTWGMPMNKSAWRYINHSCRASAGFRARTKIIAFRNISKGEEVTIDYSMTEGDRLWRMKCQCGVSECRRIVRSIQYLPNDIFDQYKEVISPFLRSVFYDEKTYVASGRPGLYAKRDLKKGEQVFKVEGPVVSYSFPPDYRVGPKWLSIGKNQWIAPLKQSPWLKFEHSCRPNLGMRGNDEVVALREIRCDERLTIDDSITEADPSWHKKCNCGESNCRKIIRSIQFLPEEIYQSYLPYVSNFIKKMRERKADVRG